MSKTPQRLSDYPWVVVRFDCTLCKRRGCYRLARLAEKFGAEATLREVLDAVTFDCPWTRRPGQRPPRKYEVRCGARFADIETALRPPADLPQELKRDGFTVIEGGRPKAD